MVVHGVGDQAPKETAHRVVNLLLDLSRDGHRRGVQYSPFSEETVDMAVRPVSFRGTSQAPLRMEVPERSTYIKGLHAVRQREAAADDLDILFTQGQLDDFRGEGPSGAYETVRMEGSRLDAKGQIEQDVHVYEMYWGDLSRLTRGWFRVFAELYQLLFEVSSLGRKNMDFVLAEHPDNGWWRAARCLQSRAVWAYTWAVPTFCLLLIATMLAILPSSLLSPAGCYGDSSSMRCLQTWIAWGVLGLVALLGWGVLWMRLGIASYWLWMVPPVATMIAIVWSVWCVCTGFDDPASRASYVHLLTAEWLLLTYGLVGWLMRQYGERHPGVFTFYLVWSVVFVGMFLWKLWGDQKELPIPNVALNVGEWTFAGLVLSWGMIVGLGFCAHVCTWIGCCSIRCSKQRLLARRAAWTARLSLALPIAVFLIFSLGIGSALYWKYESQISTMGYTPTWVGDLFCQAPAQCGTVREFIKNLLDVSATSFLVIFLALIGVAFLLAVWSLAPSVWSEIPPFKDDDERATRLGAWLTHGYRLLRGSGEVIYIATFWF